jgi:hypothetical protein
MGVCRTADATRARSSREPGWLDNRSTAGPEATFDTRRQTTVTKSICALVAVALSFGCSKPDSYRPVYYPSAADLTTYTRGPAFDNLAEARQWVKDQRRQRQDVGATYEIGKNCHPFQDTDIEVCKETLR